MMNPCRTCRFWCHGYCTYVPVVPPIESSRGCALWEGTR
jgi:hypothetical protein